MAISKKASVLAILLIGVVAVVMKMLLDPFGSKESQVALKPEEVVVANIPTAPTQPVEPAPVAPTASMPVPAPTQPAEPVQALAVAKQVVVNTSYGSPAGEEKVTFALKVDANGVITSAETGVKATNDTSIKYQNAFKGGLPGTVVGKKLTDLTSIDKVGKASLTTNAFNLSLSKLKAQM